MKVVTAKGLELQVTQFVKWEDSHAKYEGVAYCKSDKGAEYMAYVLKGSQSVDLKYCNTFSVRDSGKAEIQGLEIKPYVPVNIPMPSFHSGEKFEKMIMEKFAIKSTVTIEGRSLTISFQTVQSASTLLRAFKRNQPTIKCLDYLNYQLILSI